MRYSTTKKIACDVKVGDLVKLYPDETYEDAYKVTGIKLYHKPMHPFRQFTLARNDKTITHHYNSYEENLFVYDKLSPKQRTQRIISDRIRSYVDKKYLLSEIYMLTVLSFLVGAVVIATITSVVLNLPK